MSETITAAQLRAAADLIEAPERWTDEAYALSAHGRPCRPTSLRAVAWSTSGAVARQAGDGDITSALDAIDPRRLMLTQVDGHAAAVAELRRLADLADAREGTVGA